MEFSFWEYVVQNWPTAIVVALILVVNTFPRIYALVAETWLPHKLKHAEDQIAWERKRIDDADRREDLRVEFLGTVANTLIFIQRGIEDIVKEHREDRRQMLDLIKTFSDNSTDEHKSILQIINYSQRLHELLIEKIENRRYTDFSTAEEKK
jgi:hypothetical protein